MRAREEDSLQPVDGFHPQCRHRHRKLGGFVLNGIEPVRIGTDILEQPVARAQRAFERVDPRHMLGIERQREPVEKSTALGRRPVEQAVHSRHQPNDAQMIGERRCRCDRLAIDAAFARDDRVLVRGRLDAGAQRRQSQRTFYLRRYCPRTVAFGKSDVFEGCSPQTASRRQKRNRLDQVRLAGAVGADQHYRSRARLELGGAVAAEIRDGEAADAGSGHTGNQ